MIRLARPALLVTIATLASLWFGGGKPWGP
jgi:hypothetical protein